MTNDIAAETDATRRLGGQLMESFFEGWSKEKLEPLLSIFHDEGVFLETPHTASLKGLPAIRRYWSDVPLHQSEITATYGEIFAAGPWFSTEFKVVFRRRRTGEWIDARGAVFCETDGEKVTEMRMYWHRLKVRSTPASGDA